MVDNTAAGSMPAGVRNISRYISGGFMTLGAVLALVDPELATSAQGLGELFEEPEIVKAVAAVSAFTGAVISAVTGWWFRRDSRKGN